MADNPKPAPQAPAPGSVDVHPKNEELWNSAAEAFGTAAIFEKRARKYRRLIRVLTFYGLVIPLVIGLVVMGSIADAKNLKAAVYWAAVLAGIQVVFFLWSVVANWPDRLEHAVSSNVANVRLSGDFKSLAEESVKPGTQFDVEYAKVTAEYKAQVAQDQASDVSEDEKTFGYRAGLVQFQRKCTLCKEEAPSMEMPFWRKNQCQRCGGPKKK